QFTKCTQFRRALDPSKIGTRLRRSRDMSLAVPHPAQIVLADRVVRRAWDAGARRRNPTHPTTPCPEPAGPHLVPSQLLGLARTHGLAAVAVFRAEPAIFEAARQCLFCPLPL